MASFSAAAASAGACRIRLGFSVAVVITNIPAFHMKRFEATIFFAVAGSGFSTKRLTW